MRNFSVLLALALVIASSEAIFNGDLSPHKPYFARVTYRAGNQPAVLHKSGTIISDRFVLTTGSFLVDANDIQIWVGSQVRAQQQSHPGSGSLRLSNFPDGPALIQLANPLVFNQFVHSIRLIQNDLMGVQNEQGMIVGMGGIVAGDSRDRLNAAFMRITTPQICGTNYPERNNTAYFCAYDERGRTDFCPEDQGSAFTIIHRGEEFLVGIAIDSVCSIIVQSRPSLFASIRHFRNVINEILDGRSRVPQ
jgi:hypothetical protein